MMLGDPSAGVSVVGGAGGGGGDLLAEYEAHRRRAAEAAAASTAAADAAARRFREEAATRAAAPVPRGGYLPRLPPAAWAAVGAFLSTDLRSLVRATHASPFLRRALAPTVRAAAEAAAACVAERLAVRRVSEAAFAAAVFGPGGPDAAAALRAASRAPDDAAAQARVPPVDATAPIAINVHLFRLVNLLCELATGRRSATLADARATICVDYDAFVTKVTAADPLATASAIRREAIESTLARVAPAELPAAAAPFFDLVAGRMQRRPSAKLAAAAKKHFAA